MDPLSYQITSVITSLLMGLAVGLIFDLYRLLRGYFKPRWWLTQIGDILFWILATVISFLILLKGNWGEVRPYVFIGVILGFYTHLKVLSRSFQLFILKITGIIIYTIKLIIKIVVFPINLLARIVLIPIGIISYLFRKLVSLLNSIRNIIYNIIKKLLRPVANLSKRGKGAMRRKLRHIKQRIKLKLTSRKKKE